MPYNARQVQYSMIHKTTRTLRFAGHKQSGVPASSTAVVAAGGHSILVAVVLVVPILGCVEATAAC